MTATAPSFTFAALPMGGGGGDIASPSQHKRPRSDDVLDDKLKAVQVTSTESDSTTLNATPNPVSYASMLLNPMSNYGKAAIEDVVFSDEDCSYSGDNPVPSVYFSERLKDKLHLEWRCAVIIKLIGKPNSSNALKFMSDSLKRKWKLQGPWQLIDLPNDYFVVKFHLHEDMNIALCGGPWIISGQTLVVQQWRPDFDPYANKITSMAVWVRIVGLPLHFYKDFPMRKIGHLLGSVVKVDKLTLSQIRGQFARLCIEVDLNKPLIPFVAVEGCKYGVVYEGISMICFNCGCFGHVKTNCAFKKPDEQPGTEVPVNPVTNNVPADVHMSMATETPDPTVLPATTKESTSNGHGPWMLMTYKNKKRESTANGNNKDQGASGSRFSILETDEDANAASEADNMKAPVTPKVTLPTDNEPRIVSLWKNLQKKLHDKDSNEKVSHSKKSNSDFTPSSSSGSRKASSHPMKDITNGLPVVTMDKKLGRGKPRKSGTGSKMVKGSTAGVKQFSIPLLDAPSIFKATNSATFSTNVPASFGHCPPEIDPDATIIGEDSASVHTSTAQVCSDFASDIPNKVTNIPIMAPILDSSDNEASMSADMSSSMEENMIVS